MRQAGLQTRRIALGIPSRPPAGNWLRFAHSLLPLQASPPLALFGVLPPRDSNGGDIGGTRHLPPAGGKLASFCRGLIHARFVLTPLPQSTYLPFALSRNRVRFARKPRSQRRRQAFGVEWRGPPIRLGPGELGLFVQPSPRVARTAGRSRPTVCRGKLALFFETRSASKLLQLLVWAELVLPIAVGKLGLFGAKGSFAGTPPGVSDAAGTAQRKAGSLRSPNWVRFAHIIVVQTQGLSPAFGRDHCVQRVAGTGGEMVHAPLAVPLRRNHTEMPIRCQVKSSASTVLCATRFCGACAVQSVILSVSEGSGPRTRTDASPLRCPDASLRSA
jgi:hypothetical protein